MSTTKITHHCSNCGEAVEGACMTHSDAIVDSIVEVVSQQEAFLERMARLGLTACNETRAESLQRAHAAGVPDAVFTRLANAVRVGRKSTVVLPMVRYEGLSRGRGWARCGRGDAATWGERESGGYRVGPGRWTVYGSDGFRREERVAWQVEHVKVGTETWTIAN